MASGNKIDDKISKLKQTWKNRDDSVGKRLVGEIINKYEDSDLLIEAILKDETELFDIVFDHSPSAMVYSFDVACVCGSENIVNYLVNNYQFDVSQSNDAIGYALSSGNFKLANELAHAIKDKGKTNPGNIYLYNACTFFEAKQIVNYLNDQHSENNDQVPKKGRYL